MPLLRRNSFRKPELTLQQLLVYGKDLEDTEFRTDVFDDSKKKCTDEEINKIGRRFGKKPFQGRKGKDSIAEDSKTKKCYRCGGKFPHSNRCPAVGKKCNFFKKIGHFERCCMRKNKAAKTSAIDTCSSSSLPFILLSFSIKVRGPRVRSLFGRCLM
uniref:Uncharacterized protein n=1 Tax=Clytia hemisphaerica TaxID=252671 RepID=A0A7M5UF89_9CNID